jgi:hypothetical protein
LSKFNAARLQPNRVLVPGRRKSSRVFAGHLHDFALACDGSLWSWGLNNFGQCGFVPSDPNERRRVESAEDVQPWVLTPCELVQFRGFVWVLVFRWFYALMVRFFLKRRREFGVLCFDFKKIQGTGGCG